MRKTVVGSVRGIALISLLLALAGMSRASYRPGEVLVKYRTDKSALSGSRVMAIGGQLTRQLDGIRTQIVKLPQGMSVEDAVSQLSSDPDVEYAGPNHIVAVCWVKPNDDYFYDQLLGFYWQWGLYSDFYPEVGIDAPDAWEITTGSSDVTIAIVDTGVDLQHEDLYAKIVPGRNVITGAINPNNPQDDFGHGTFVAGVAAAMTNNTYGVAGVSWGAKIMPIKALDYRGYGTEADAAAGIIWAADHGARIISMSFGGYDDMPVEQDAVAYAWGKGCVLVGASGNDGSSQLFFPASYDQVIAVGASNEAGGRCTAADWGEGGSNYGDYLDVMAPGNMIISTYWDYEGSTYNFASGTSAAAPFVSGIAALLAGEHPTWTNLEIANQIKVTCKEMADLGWDEFTGWGLVSAYYALVTPPLQAVTLSSLSSAEDGSLVRVSQAVLTCTGGEFPDRLYLEQENRSAGIMVSLAHPPTGLVEGDIVELIGGLRVSNGERCLQGAALSKTAHRNPLKPLGMPNRDVGGTQLGQKTGVDGGRGLNNMSLLTTVCGRVTAVGWTYFYIDDGSSLFDGSGLGGLKVICGKLQKPMRGSIVRVTGISSCEQPQGAGVTIPVVRARRQSDIFRLF